MKDLLGGKEVILDPFPWKPIQSVDFHDLKRVQLWRVEIRDWENMGVLRAFDLANENYWEADTIQLNQCGSQTGEETLEFEINFHIEPQYK